MNINSKYHCTILSLVLLSRINSVISDSYGGAPYGYDPGAYVDAYGQYNSYGYGYDQGYGTAYDQLYAQGYAPGYDQAYTQGYAPGYDQAYTQGYGTGYDKGYDQGYDPAYGSAYDPAYAAAYGQSYPQQYADPSYGVGYDQYFDAYAQYPGYPYQDKEAFEEVDVIDSHDERHSRGRDSYGQGHGRGMSSRDRSHYKGQGYTDQEYFSGNFDQVGFTDPYETRSERSYGHAKSTSSGRYKEQTDKSQPEFKTVMLDISSRKSTNSIKYDFDVKSQTHTYTAAEGYLFEGAIDENAEQVWVPENNKFADKITVTQTGPGMFSIKAFVPVEGTSSSDFDTDRDKLPAGRRLDKMTGRPMVQPKFQSKVVQQVPPKQFEITQRHSVVQQGPRRKIDIDLNTRRSTEQVLYQYNSRYFIHSYKARAGFRIGRVIRAGKVKYEHMKGPIPDEAIVIVLPNGSEVLRILYPSEPGEAVSEGEYKMAPAKLSYVNVDIKKFESSEGFKYTFDSKYKIHRFTCNDNYRFRKILKNGDAVRSYPDNDCPDRILIFNVPGKGSTLRVLHPGQDEGLQEIIKLITPTEPEKVEEEEPTLITVDVKNLRSTDQIEFREEPDGTRVFVCKSGYLISKIVKEDLVLERFTKDFPNKVTVSIDQFGKRIVDFSSPFKPELITLDIRRRADSSQFKYERDHKNRDIFTAIRPNLFFEVRKDNDLLWYSRDGRYPDKVYIIPIEGSKPVLRVFYPKDVTYPVLKKVEAYRPDMYRKEDFEVPPEPKEEKPTRARDVYQHPKDAEPPKKEPTAKPTKAEPEPAKIKVEKAIPELDQIKVVDAKAKPTTETLHPVTLNISKRTNTDSYTYNATGKLGTFKANLGYGFNDVIENEKNKIWNTMDPDKYASEVYADGIGFTASLSNVSIYTADKQYIHFHKLKGKTWIEIPPVLELDIEHKGSTLQVYYEPRGKTHVYFANYNFLFNKVLEKGKVVWDSQARRECVMVHYNEQGERGKEVTIYLPDGVISLRKDETSKQWIDLDAVEGSGQTEAKTMNAMTEIEILRDFDVKKLKIYTIEGSDFDNPKENDDGAFLKINKGEDHKFEMRVGKKCIEVKYNNKSFWKYDKEKHGRLFPGTIQFQKESLVILVDFGIIALKYKYNGEDMQLVFTRKPGPIEVDMSKSVISEISGSSGAVSSFQKDSIIREEKNNIVTYSTKEQYAFNPVKYGDQKFHGTMDPFDYVCTIKAQPPSAPERLRIVMLNGKAKNFAKATDGKWSEFPAGMEMFT